MGSSRARIGTCSLYKYRGFSAFVALVTVLFFGHFDPADAYDVGEGEARMVFAQSNGKNFNIFYSLSSGQSWSEKIQLSYGTQDDMLPAVAAGANGMCWVVWGRGDVTNAKLFYTMCEDGSWSDPREIQTDLPFNHAPSIMVDEKDIPWVAWHADEGAGSDIFFTRWNGNGWDPAVRVNEKDNTPDLFPLIGTDDDGRPWICWTGYDGNRYRIYSSKWSGDGWGKEVLSETQNLYADLQETQKRGKVPRVPDFVDNPPQATLFIGRHKKLQSLPMRYVGYPLFSERTATSEGVIEGETADAAGDLIVKGFGDSITQGVGDDPPISEPGDGRRVGGYEPKLETLLNNASRPSQVYNWGWWGEDTVVGKSRIRDVLEAGSSKHILILEGTNDQCHMIPVSDTIKNLGRMIDDSRAYNVEPILATLLPDTSFVCGTKPIDIHDDVFGRCSCA